MLLIFLRFFYVCLFLFFFRHSFLDLMMIKRKGQLLPCQVNFFHLDTYIKCSLFIGKKSIKKKKNKRQNCTVSMNLNDYFRELADKSIIFIFVMCFYLPRDIGGISILRKTGKRKKIFLTILGFDLLWID